MPLANLRCESATTNSARALAKCSTTCSHRGPATRFATCFARASPMCSTTRSPKYPPRASPHALSVRAPTVSCSQQTQHHQSTHQFMRLANTFSLGTPRYLAMGMMSSRKPPLIIYTATPRFCSVLMRFTMPCATRSMQGPPPPAAEFHMQEHHARAITTSQPAELQMTSRHLTDGEAWWHTISVLGLQRRKCLSRPK